MRRIFRNRLADLLLESLVPVDSPVLLQFLVTAIRLLDQERRESSLVPRIPLARLQQRLGCSPDVATSLVQRLVVPPALVVISEAPQGAQEIALANALWNGRAELLGTLEVYLAAVAAFARIPPPQDRLDRAFLQARICFNGGLFFETHEILEGEWSRLAKGPLRTLLQGIIQISVGFHHGRRGGYAGAVNQLGKGLEKLRHTLVEFPDPNAEEFRQVVQRVRDRLLAGGLERMAPLELGEIPSLTIDLPVSLRSLH